MKKLALALATAVLSTTAFAQTMEVNTTDSKLEWVGEKVTGKHWGTVNISGGTIEVKDGKITGGEIHVDMTTINVEDLEGDSKAKLTGHLKSDDFFSVEKNPKVKFVITKVKADSKLKNGNTHTITGELTIKGNTETISFPARVNMEDGEMTAFASFKLDRTKWNIRYGSGSFFDNLGDKTIYDEFQVKFNIKAS